MLIVQIIIVPIVVLTMVGVFFVAAATSMSQPRSDNHGDPSLTKADKYYPTQEALPRV